MGRDAGWVTIASYDGCPFGWTSVSSAVRVGFRAVGKRHLQVYGAGHGKTKALVEWTLAHARM